MTGKNEKIFKVILAFTIVYVLCVISYGLFFSSLHGWMKKMEMQDLVREIQNMDMDLFEDEDEEILREYEEDNYKVYIADENFTPIYVPNGNAEYLIRRYIENQAADYSEDSKVQERKIHTNRLIYQNLLVRQKGKAYYVFIRLNMQFYYESISITVAYLMLAGLGLVLLLYYLLNKLEFYAVSDRMNEKEKQYETAQKEFIVNIVHELKTPLAVISSQLELLESGDAYIDREKYYASIQEEVDRISAQISQMLDQNITENSIERMQLMKLNLSELISYMTLRYQSLMAQREIILEQAIDENCFVNGNRKFLEQAVNNYLMNAFQNTMHGGIIRLSLSEEKGAACFSVCNEGSHIKEEALNHIWDRYVRADNVTDHGFQEMKNAGIGLHMVKCIAVRHGGKYGAENIENGVRFWLELPLYKRR